MMGRRRARKRFWTLTTSHNEGYLLMLSVHTIKGASLKRSLVPPNAAVSSHPLFSQCSKWQHSIANYAGQKHRGHLDLCRMLWLHLPATRAFQPSRIPALCQQCAAAPFLGQSSKEKQASRTGVPPLSVPKDNTKPVLFKRKIITHRGLRVCRINFLDELS